METSLRTAPIRGIPSDKRYYHGAGSEQAAEDILRHGIKPPEISGESRGLTPVRGHVYLSSDLSFASLYAGKKERDRYGALKGKPQYRYIFVVYPSDLRDVYPDEDEIGEMVSKEKPAWLHELAEQELKHRYGEPQRLWVLPDNLDNHTRALMAAEEVDPSDPDEVSDWLEENGQYDQEYFWEWEEPNLYDAVMGGEYVAWAEAGKVLLPMLDDDQVLDLISYGKNIAHKGVVTPSECWKIRWGSGVKLENYSDLEQYAERCTRDALPSLRKLKTRLLRVR